MDATTPTMHIGTPDDVARLLRLSKRTVLRRAERGELPAVRIGSLYRFDLDKIAGLFEAGEGT